MNLLGSFLLNNQIIFEIVFSLVKHRGEFYIGCFRMIFLLYANLVQFSLEIVLWMFYASIPIIAYNIPYQVIFLHLLSKHIDWFFTLKNWFPFWRKKVFKCIFVLRQKRMFNVWLTIEDDFGPIEKRKSLTATWLNFITGNFLSGYFLKTSPDVTSWRIFKLTTDNSNSGCFTENYF